MHINNRHHGFKVLEGLFGKDLFLGVNNLRQRFPDKKLTILTPNLYKDSIIPQASAKTRDDDTCDSAPNPN